MRPAPGDAILAVLTGEGATLFLPKSMQFPAAALNGLISFSLTLWDDYSIEVECQKSVKEDVTLFITTPIAPAFCDRAARPKSLSIWQEDVYGEFKKTCEHPVEIHLPNPNWKTPQCPYQVNTPTADQVAEPKSRAFNKASPVNSGYDGPAFLIIGNDGPDIKSTNFWDTEMAGDGRIFASTNAGHLRLLVPDNRQRVLDDMLKGVSILELDVLPHSQWKDGVECATILFEDDSDEPYRITFDPKLIDKSHWESGDLLNVSFWVQRDQKPFCRKTLTAKVTIKSSLNWL